MRQLRAHSEHCDSGVPRSGKQFCSKKTEVKLFLTSGYLYVALIIGLLGCDENKRTSSAPDMTETPHATFLETDDPLRGQIHDVFLKNYKPTAYLLKHSSHLQGGVENFISDRSDVGFATKDPSQCPDCYSFVINLNVVTTDSKKTSARCAPTINLQTGAVVEWNSRCSELFVSKPLLPAPHERPNDE